MSFSKVNSGGWSVGAVLTSAQMNQLDADHANALDKSAAGDTLIGEVNLASTAVIGAAYAGNISAVAAAAIISSAAGGIASTVVGGITLAGGGTDEVSYASARTEVRYHDALPLGPTLSSGWTSSGTGLMIGPALNGAQYCGPFIVHNGATLTNVRVVVAIASHSNLPANMPVLQVQRSDGAVLGSVTASAGTASAWNATTHIDVPCSANNVIDRTQYSYSIGLVDEYGSNSVAGNIYKGFIETSGSITTMAFA